MRFIASKTNDGLIKGKIAFYCRMLKVICQGFHNYLINKDKPWKYEELAKEMVKIHSEDEYNDTYGRVRMNQALILKDPENILIPSERTVYRVMEEIGLSHKPKRKDVERKECARLLRKLRNKIAHGDFVAFEKCVENYAVELMDGRFAFDYSEYSRKNWVVQHICCLLDDVIRQLIHMLFYDRSKLDQLKKGIKIMTEAIK